MSEPSNGRVYLSAALLVGMLVLVLFAFSQSRLSRIEDALLTAESQQTRNWLSARTEVAQIVQDATRAAQIDTTARAADSQQIGTQSAQAAARVAAAQTQVASDSALVAQGVSTASALNTRVSGEVRQFNTAQAQVNAEIAMASSQIAQDQALVAQGVQTAAANNTRVGGEIRRFNTAQAQVNDQIDSASDQIAQVQRFAATVSAQEAAYEQLLVNRGPAVVAIFNSSSVPRLIVDDFAGSGFLYQRDTSTDASTYVITNAHVVSYGTRMELDQYQSQFNVRIPNPTRGLDAIEEREAELVGVSPCDDIAVLRLRSEERFPGTVTDSNFGVDVPALSNVILFGYGSNLIRDEANSLVVGSPSVNVGWLIGYDQGESYPPLREVLRHTAVSAPGDSGGPLFALDGQLVGMNTAHDDGITYAIRSWYVRDVVDRMLNPERGLRELYPDTPFDETRGIRRAQNEMYSVLDRDCWMFPGTVGQTLTVRLERPAEDASEGFNPRLTLYSPGNLPFGFSRGFWTAETAQPVEYMFNVTEDGYYLAMVSRDFGRDRGNPASLTGDLINPSAASGQEMGYALSVIEVAAEQP